MTAIDRECLRCRKMFKSTLGYRLCNKCHQENDRAETKYAEKFIAQQNADRDLRLEESYRE